MAAKREASRGLLYLRDSKGKGEQAPQAYVEWAQREAKRHGVTFDGTVDDVNELIRRRGGIKNGIYLDYGVKGNKLSRPAFDELQTRIENERDITHLFVPRRDRLARPDQASDAMVIEASLRRWVTIVYDQAVVAPLEPGRRLDVGEAIQAYVDFDNSGRFRDVHGRKMLYARVQRAREGFSAGASPPYGFCRALYCGEEFVRLLQPGEVVILQGHGVRWIPGPPEKVEVVKRIVELLKRIPANQVAQVLNREGIPSPGHGRMITRKGITRPVSGTWNQNSVLAVARNPRVKGLMENGRRSAGDRVRFSPDGPRELDARDFKDGQQLKTIRNPIEQVISVRIDDGLVPADEMKELDAILKQRARTQRGKPRSPTPEKNPLGGRIFDLNCTWLMHRQPRQHNKYGYICGLYKQSAGSSCHFHFVSGADGVQFAMTYLRQRLLIPAGRRKLEDAIRRRAKVLAGQSSHDRVLERLTAKLAEVDSLIGLAEKNLSRAESDQSFKVIERQLTQLLQQQKQLQREQAESRQVADEKRSVKEIERGAIAEIDHLAELAADDSNLRHVSELFQRLDVKLYMSFGHVRKAKYTKSKIVGGVLTLGAVEPPIQVHSGATSISDGDSSKESFSRHELRKLRGVKQAKA